MIVSSLRDRHQAWLFALFVVAGLLPSIARADYTINPGDVLGLTVTGVSELDTKALVDADGNIVLPLIGVLPVAGSSVAEVTARIQAALPNKELNHRLVDGRTIPVIISPGQISVAMVEYRPVYVVGDVAKPGALSYRPGMTIRQAVALAGGFDLLRFKLDNPLMQISDLMGEYNSLSVDYAKTQAIVIRLQAELDGNQALNAKAMADVPVAESLSAEIMKNEQNQLEVRNQDFAKEQQYLISAAQKEGQRAHVLGEQEANDVNVLKTDSEDLDRYNDLFKKGAVAMPLLQLARRTVLESSTRALQTTAALASVEREEGEIDRRLARLGDTRRIELLHGLEEATAQLANTRAKLQAVNTKLRYVGAAKSPLVRGFDKQVTIAVTRSSNGKSSQITALPDTELQPGDVAEIVLPSAEPGAAPQSAVQDHTEVN
jgi:polysaccharide export outer membrane protein